MRKVLFGILAAVTLLLSFGAGIGSAEGQTDINALIQETQQRSDKPGEMVFVWWIPEEYWKASFSQNPNMTAQQVEDFVKVFRPYTLIAVVEGKMGTYGTITYKNEADIRGEIKLKDTAGTEYTALSDEAVNVDTKNLLAMMKPVLANILGPMGQNMYFYLFPNTNKEGKSLYDIGKAGSFSVMLADKEFKWKLPLSSLLPQKTCPTCNEKLKGSYKYCPWDGTKLP